MITSTLIQAAQVALDELHVAYPSETDRDEAVALMGVGPRALAHFVESFSGDLDITAIALNAFLTGAFAERYRNELDAGMISEIDIEEVVEEPYEGADRDDLQDVLHVVFGIQTDNDIEDEELANLMITNIFGSLVESHEVDEYATEDEGNSIMAPTGL